MVATNIVLDGNTNFETKFTPEDANECKATVEISSDDPDTALYKFDVVAHGSSDPEPDVNVKLDGSNFPNNCIFYFFDTHVRSSSDPITFIVENKGSGNLILDSILYTGDIESFDIDYDADSLTITPGGKLPVIIWPIPKEVKKYALKLVIECNDPDEEKYIIKLVGNEI